MSDSLATSFSKMVNLIESETKFLKGISNLRGADTEVQDKLKDLDSFVSALEINLNDFESFVNMELAALDAVEKLGEQSELQLADVCALKENIPQFLNTAPQKHQHQPMDGGKGHSQRRDNSSAPLLPRNKRTDKPGVTFEEEEESGRGEGEGEGGEGGASASASAAAVALFITTEELAAVPKSTRGRLTLAQVTAALHTVVALVADKQKLLSKTRKRLSPANKASYEEYKRLQCQEHGAEVFLLERELRASAVFGSGEASGRAALHTLRALRRLQLVRSGGETTYVLAPASCSASTPKTTR